MLNFYISFLLISLIINWQNKYETLNTNKQKYQNTNLIGQSHNKYTKKVFGPNSFFLTVEGMGPYPLSDSTNLLMGPPQPIRYNTTVTANPMNSMNTTNITSALASCQYVNYGTNLNTPVPSRKCYYNRDSFRRHSAHGRMCTTPSGIRFHYHRNNHNTKYFQSATNTPQ